ncbi:hypothetical protein EJ08DRAFT_205761 [Tothia fuscella]|uniref:Uncharacterized protein n=1 Tax=Tothia fuscella TaxID=1048955 RepID=A0A9P4NT52_9PEZI|nr:hypothetical protein EJ08DRAFT_205761 [Tothia fuscella]
MLQTPDSTCLFYTSGNTANARDYAKTKAGLYTTIWEIWPKKYYNDDEKDKKNPLRCIMADAVIRREYFVIMSGAMATLCSTAAIVMTENIDAIDNNGIWGQTERPTLEKTGNVGGQVDTIMAGTSPDPKTKKKIWQRPGTANREINMTKKLKFDDNCGASGDVKRFDKGGASEVDW